MTLTAMRPEAGRSKGREVSLWRVSPASRSNLGLEGGLERLVGVVAAQDVGVAAEEAPLVVVGVDEPAGNAFRTIAADLAGIGMEHVRPIDLDLNLTRVGALLPGPGWSLARFHLRMVSFALFCSFIYMGSHLVTPPLLSLISNMD